MTQQRLSSFKLGYFRNNYRQQQKRCSSVITSMYSTISYFSHLINQSFVYDTLRTGINTGVTVYVCLFPSSFLLVLHFCSYRNLFSSKIIVSICCLQNTAHLHLPATATDCKSPIQQEQLPLLQFKCSACSPLTSTCEIPARHSRYRVAVWYTQVPLFRGNILCPFRHVKVYSGFTSDTILYIILRSISFVLSPSNFTAQEATIWWDDIPDSCQDHGHLQQETLIGMQQIFTACLTNELLRSPIYSSKGLRT